MKFLCVECDDAMKLLRTEGPSEGSLTVIFGCPSCHREVAMLTNAMETQMVRSLGVKIGGQQGAAAPMATVRSSLAHQRDESSDSASATVEPKPAQGAPATSETSKCPFTGMVEDAFAQQRSALRWTSEAEARLARIPEFVRPMVRKSIEQYARENDLQQIDASVLDTLKGHFGMESPR